MSNESILVVNSGSSSLKFGLFAQQDGQERLLCQGEIDGIARDGGVIELKDAQGRILRSANHRYASQGDALDQAAAWLAEFSPGKPQAVGHRVAHSGPRFTSHQRITAAVLAELRACLHFAPLHIPTALELIERAGQSYPGIPQFACFDTVFHNTLPEAAARFALPRELFEQGIRRYGFHGLSYESIVRQLGADLPSRVVIAHLGNGASLAALKDGISIDTSMGLTPAGGIPMATRSGDLDPGVLLYLLRAKQLSVESLEALLNHDSGLKALSGGKDDMRDIEAAADAADQPAQLAIQVFCQSICKGVAAYAAALGGLDMLIFTGGIGEHSLRVRRNVTQGLEFLGLFRICVVASQEDRQIAGHCRAMMRNNQTGSLTS